MIFIVCLKNRIETCVPDPGKIGEPRVYKLNESHIQVKWEKPDKPGGKNDFYEVLFKEESKTENKTVKMYNVTSK